MDKFDRFYDLIAILKARHYPISLHNLARELECAPATAKRLIKKLREELDAPIILISDRKAGGYFLERRNDEHEQYELPGLWFNPSELFALLAMQQLLGRTEPGFFQDKFASLRNKVEKLLAVHKWPGALPLERIRILGLGCRPGRPRHFRNAAHGVLQRRRLRLVYLGRADDRETNRTVSPQRLIYYRDNWYLDAWCHEREEFRTFTLDRVRDIRLQEAPARDFTSEELDRHFATGYGIFAGPAGETAILRFTPDRARWVADEQWHPEQQGRVLPDGSYELRLPYADARELILDILRYGPDVEVIGPEHLRRTVRNRLRQALARYGAD